MIRGRFGGQSEEETALGIDESVEMPEPVWSHFKALMRNNRQPMSSWSSTVMDVSETGFKIVAKTLLMLNPSANNDVFQTGLRLLRMVQRLHLHTTYPAIWRAVRDRADMFLTQAR